MELFDQLSGEARNDQKFLMGVSETLVGVPTRNRALRTLTGFTPRDRTNKPVSLGERTARGQILSILSSEAGETCSPV